ncbi:MAG: hypothetical protein J1E80_02575 [Desulfovibrionaceae bacterium]|nr:hypothetical protein [Desulfovibrionaceae bacterium]
MAFWRKRNRAVERATAEVMRPLPVRWALMLGLFAITGALWWNHFDHRLNDIKAESAFWDETGTWSAADRRSLALRARAFRQHWGLDVAAHVRSGPLQLPRLKEGVLFIGMAPQRGEAMLIVPGLASTALKAEGARQGRDMRLALEEDLGLCLRDTPSKDCLLRTLDSLDALFASHGEH